MTTATIAAVKAPTVQQEAIYDAIASESGHVVVEALAGTGKTTTAIGCAGRSRGRTGFVCFNKHIQAELDSRLKGAAKACTMHSLGLAACRRIAGDVQVEEKKPQEILRRLRPAWFWEGKRGGVRLHDEAKAVLALARLCKYTLTDPGDRQALTGLIDHFGVETPQREANSAKAMVAALREAGCSLDPAGPVEIPAEPPPGLSTILAGSLDRLRPDITAIVWGEAVDLGPHVAQLLEECATDTRRVDYDDMVWLPVRLGLPVQRFDLLMVDEAQDLNRCQQALSRMASDGGRLVPIGDRRQSLYSFAGADPEALPRLLRDLSAHSDGCASLPLTVTWRCPSSHVALANRLGIGLEAAPSAEAGVIGEIDPDEVRHHVQPGDLVLARRNAPLVKLALEMVRHQVPVLLRGRDIGGGLLGLIEDLRADSPLALLGKLEDYAAAERERLERRNAADSLFDALADRVACLSELATVSVTIQEMRDRLHRLFGDNPTEAAGKVVLSSIHRAKGLEADHVVITDTGCLPLIRTCRECRGKGCPTCGGRGTRAKQWEVQTEYNLAYVAVTRAKKRLLFAGGMPALFGAF